MDRKLLTAAALVAALIATPSAGAQHRVSEGSPRHDMRGDHRFHRGFGGNAAAAWGNYELRSSYDDRDWAAESGNDWWHDRPERAFPRWVQDQRARGSCDPERMWWSGSGWHC